jgi:hypothetical protein
VTPSELGAVLGAALLHASWNTLPKRRGEPLLATVLVVAGPACVAIVLLPFLPAPARASWPFIAASGVVQSYFLLLIETYRAGRVHAMDLSADGRLGVRLRGPRPRGRTAGGRHPDHVRRGCDAAGLPLLSRHRNDGHHRHGSRMHGQPGAA